MIRKLIFVALYVVVIAGIYFLAGGKSSLSLNFYNYSLNLPLATAAVILLTIFVAVVALLSTFRDMAEWARTRSLKSKIKKSEGTLKDISFSLKTLALGDAKSVYKSLKKIRNKQGVDEWVGYLSGLGNKDFEEAHWHLKRLQSSDLLTEEEALRLEGRLAHSAGDSQWINSVQQKSLGNDKVLSLPSPEGVVKESGFNIVAVDPLKNEIDMLMMRLTSVFSEKNWNEALKYCKELHKKQKKGKSVISAEKLSRALLIEIKSLIELKKYRKAALLMEKNIKTLANNQDAPRIYLMAKESSVAEERIRSLQRWHMLTSFSASARAWYVTELIHQRNDDQAIPLLKKLQEENNLLTADERLMILSAIIKRDDEDLNKFLKDFVSLKSDKS